MNEDGVTDFEEIACGLGFVEGPVWTGAGLVVTSITHGVLYRIDLPSAAVHTHASPGGGPNGLARSADGMLWAAQGGGGHFGMECVSTRPAGLLRITPEGDVGYAVDAGLTAPSDCAFGPDGRLWFTDPQQTFEATAPGKLVTYDPATGVSRPVTVDEQVPDGFYPNGIAFGADPGALYVADTSNRRVLRFDITDGRPSAPRPFTTCRGFPDGLAVDAEGNVYVALLTEDRIAVHTPSGDLLDVIEIPGSRPTNLCFAGDDLTSLVVTASGGGRVLIGEAPVPGLALHVP